MTKDLNKVFRKIIAVILAVAMLLSMFSITSFAEGTEPEYVNTNPYTLTFVQEIEGYEEYSVKRFSYVIPYLNKNSYTDPATGAVSEKLEEAHIFNLTDTVKVAAGPQTGEEGTPYASLWAYCSDKSISIADDSNYRRINLEDCTYYDDVASGRIRAVILNSVPAIQDASVIQTAINTWLAENKGEGNYTPVTDLTCAEAATATQAAIWAIANPDVYSIVDTPYGGHLDLSAFANAVNAETVWSSPIDPFESESEYAEDNVTAVFEYLYNLAPVAATAKVVSDSTIDITSATTAEGVTTVKFTTDATVGADDKLVATVFVGEEKVSFALTSENVGDTHTVAVSAEGDVRVEINGYQTAEDVFLYDAEGDHTTSQTLVGYSNANMPVHAEATTEPEHIPNIIPDTDDSMASVTVCGSVVFEVACVVFIIMGMRKKEY